MRLPDNEVPATLAAIDRRLADGSAKVVYRCESGLVVSGLGVEVTVQWIPGGGVAEVWVGEAKRGERVGGWVEGVDPWDGQGGEGG